MTTTSTTVSAEDFPVLVRADLYEWIEKESARLNQGPAPAMMEDITHCPVCARDVESLWLSESQLDAAAKDEVLALTPMCSRCREDDATPTA